MSESERLPFPAPTECFSYEAGCNCSGDGDAAETLPGYHGATGGVLFHYLEDWAPFTSDTSPLKAASFGSMALGSICVHTPFSQMACGDSARKLPKPR